jgi:hypothetical protein
MPRSNSGKIIPLMILQECIRSGFPSSGRRQRDNVQTLRFTAAKSMRECRQERKMYEKLSARTLKNRQVKMACGAIG